MADKRRTSSIIGIIIFLTGAFLLLAVILIWQFSPIFLPPSYGPTLTKNISDLDLSAPALSPFAPPVMAAGNGQPLLPFTLITPAEAQKQTANGLFSSDNSAGWSVVTYESSRGGDQSAPAIDNNLMRLIIPALGVDAPMTAVGLVSSPASNQRPHQQWSVPDAYAAGWHNSSAPPGQPGNTVLNGHNNIHGAIFHDLVDLPLGGEIILTHAGQSFVYQVTGREFLPESGQPLRTRLRNARWIMPTNDERITIVTCWPNSSSSHRLVVVAQLVENT